MDNEENEFGTSDDDDNGNNNIERLLTNTFHRFRRNHQQIRHLHQTHPSHSLYGRASPHRISIPASTRATGMDSLQPPSIRVVSTTATTTVHVANTNTNNNANTNNNNTNTNNQTTRNPQLQNNHSNTILRQQPIPWPQNSNAFADNTSTNNINMTNNSNTNNNNNTAPMNTNNINNPTPFDRQQRSRPQRPHYQAGNVQNAAVQQTNNTIFITNEDREAARILCIMRVFKLKMEAWDFIEKEIGEKWSEI